MAFVARQALLQVLGEGVGADVAEYVDMPVVTVLQALQQAFLLGLVEERVDLVHQAVVVAPRQGPGQPAGFAEVEGDADVGEVHLVHRQFVGVDQGQVDVADVDHAQQVDHFDSIGFFVLQFGILLLQLGELLRVAAALEHHDALADQVFRAGRALLAVAVDDLRGDVEVGVRVAHAGVVFASRGQAGRGECRAALAGKLGIEVVEVVGGLDLQLDAETLGEALGQFVFEAGFAVAVLEVGGRAVAGDHAQYALLLHALQGGRGFRLATARKQQKDAGRQQPGGAT